MLTDFDGDEFQTLGEEFDPDVLDLLLREHGIRDGGDNSDNGDEHGSDDLAQ